MSSSGFSIDALLTKDTADVDDVLSERELSEDTRMRTTAPLAADWLSYGGFLDGRTNGDVHLQLGNPLLYRSYDCPGANLHSTNLRIGYDSGFGNASKSGASALGDFLSEKSDGCSNSMDFGNNSSLDMKRGRHNTSFRDILDSPRGLEHSTGVKDLERRGPSPYFGNISTRSERREQSTGVKDKEVEEEAMLEERDNFMRSSVGQFSQRTSRMPRINSITNTAHTSTKPHAEGSAAQQQQQIFSCSTLRRPWEEEKVENSSLTASTPTSNAPIRRPWEVSPVHHIQPMDVSTDKHSYLGQSRQDSGYLSRGTMSMVPRDVLGCPDNPPTREVNQELDGSPEENHIDTKRVKKPARTNTIFSDETVEVMETWYVTNYDKPYPTEEQIHLLSTRACLTVRQARKWLANRRIRSHNTLAYNNNVHPKRARRLEKNRQAMLGLAASLSQNNIESGSVQIPNVNASLTTNTHSVINSINREGEIAANIQGPFTTRTSAMHVNRAMARMDDTLHFSRLSLPSESTQSGFHQAPYGYQQRPALELSSSRSNSSILNGFVGHQFREPQEQQQIFSFGDTSRIVAPPTYLSYNNYLRKEPQN